VSFFVHLGGARDVRSMAYTHKITRYLSQVYREVLSNVKPSTQHYLNPNASRRVKTFGSFRK